MGSKLGPAHGSAIFQQLVTLGDGITTVLISIADVMTHLNNSLKVLRSVSGTWW